MSIKFTVDAVLQMAQRIEINGAKFYRRGAEIVADSEHQNLLRRLAAMEDAHERVFAALRADLPASYREPISEDPADERMIQVQAMADGHVFDVDEDVSERLTGQETTEAILQMAIGLEKDAIVFYVGIKDLVPEQLGRDRVDDIINAEMDHIVILSQQLMSLQG